MTAALSYGHERANDASMEAFLLAHWSDPSRANLSAVVDWLDSQLTAGPEDCQGCSAGRDASAAKRKLATAQSVLRAGSLFIRFDARCDGVLAPRKLLRRPSVVFQVGHNMPDPIPNLRVDGDGVFGTLSFNGAPFPCFVPWAAVLELAGDDREVLAWAEAMPAECWLHWLQRQLERADDKLHNANAIHGWARAIGTRHAPCELWADAVDFGNAYAKAVSAHWSAWKKVGK